MTQHPHPCFGRSPGGRQGHPLLREAAPVPRSAGLSPGQAGRSPFSLLNVVFTAPANSSALLCSFLRTPNFNLVHLSLALAAGPLLFRLQLSEVNLQVAPRLTVRALSASLGDCGGVAPVRRFWADGEFYTQVTFLVPYGPKKGAQSWLPALWRWQ